MADLDSGTIVRGVLWAAPAILVPALFLASLPWLDDQPEALSLGLAAAAAIFVMGYGIFLSARINRRMDEVEVAGLRYAQTKGMTIGMVAAVLVMMLPPAMNALADVANRIGSGSSDEAAKLGITIGFVMVVILQTLGQAGVSIWWRRRIART